MFDGGESIAVQEQEMDAVEKKAAGHGLAGYGGRLSTVPAISGFQEILLRETAGRDRLH